MALWSTLLLAVSLAVVLTVWSAAPAMGQETLPGVAVVEPASLLWGYAPYQFTAAEQGSGLAFLALNDNAWGEDSSGHVIAQTSVSFAQTPIHPSSFETRPHAGVVWMVTAPQGEQLGDAGLAMLDASTLQVLRLLAFNSSAFSPPVSNRYTYMSCLSDLSGRLYLIIASNIYILDPITGAQTGYFSVPNYDDPTLGTPGYQNQGYLIAQHPDSSLYIIDANYFDNETWPVFHTALDGTLLSQGWVDVGDNDGLQSFVIDSAGFLYLSIYTAQWQRAVAFKVDTDFNLVGNVSFGVTDSTVLNVGGVGDYYDVEISVSWGPPDSGEADILYGFVWPYQPVYACQLSTPVACTSIYSTPYSLLDNGAIAYDTYMDSFVITQGMGPYSAVRVDSKAKALLGTFVLPNDGEELTIAVSIAVDGAGGVALGHYVPSEENTYIRTAFGVSFFQGSQLIFTVSVAGSNNAPVAIDPVAKLIYTVSGNYPVQLQVWDYLGNSAGTVAANGGGVVSSMHYHLSTSGASTVAFVDNSQNDGSLLQLDLTSGAVTSLLSIGPDLQLAEFAFSPDSSVAYIVAQTFYPQYVEGEDEGPFHTLAVQVSSGALIAQLDLLHSPPYTRDGYPAAGDGSLTVDGSGNVWVVQAQQQFSSTTGVLVFAPQTAPVATSVLGDPQFIGLRGQSFQVHGIDGGVYALVSSERLQVNARFVFLSSGTCPPITTQCWSHPGSYLQAIGVQQLLPSGALHRLSITAGPAASGFSNVTHNEQTVSVGASFSDAVFAFSLLSPHELQVRTEQLQFAFSNSDRFINQAVQPLVSLSRMSAHGLLGQTHSAQLHRSTLRYIEGEVDDYLVQGNSLFHTDFLYNRFQLPKTAE